MTWHFTFKSTHNPLFLIYSLVPPQLLTIFIVYKQTNKQTKHHSFHQNLILSILNMSENKDPSIKLFGKTIQLGSNIDEDTIVSSRSEPSSAVSATKDDIDFDCETTSSLHKFPCSKQNGNRVNQESEAEKPMDAEQEGERSSSSSLEEPKTPTSQSTKEENLNTTTKDKVMSSSQDLPKSNHDQASSNSESSDKNPLKKPDKILPCARCSSMDTKFCYFNNYNVNQPRHFCKNCQRYWTAGGSMRNVPVGAGRRKSKNSTTSHHRQLVIPEASDGLIFHVMRPDGFGLDNSHSNQSKVSMIKLGEGSQNFIPNGIFRSEIDNKNQVPLSNSNSVSVEKNGDFNGETESSQAVPCFPYGWNLVPCQRAFPMSFYTGSSSQWGQNLAAPWNLNWVPTPSMNSDQSSTNSSPNSSPLGKHSRECLTLIPSNSDNKEKNLENSRVVIPKTLRVDDPSEAAKSSIWTTLGIKNNHIGSSSGRVAFFGGLQQAKGVPYERRNINQNVEASSMVLQANPAAFSRSLSFHEIAQ